MTTNPTKSSLVLLLLAAGAVLVLGTFGVVNGSGLGGGQKPAPVGVWNDSDAAATVAVVGANGTAFFVVPAHELGTVSAPPEIGAVQRMAVARPDCRVPNGGAMFGNGSDPFSVGGQMLIRDGAFSGWTSRLPAQWAMELEPEAGGCPGGS